MVYVIGVSSGIFRAVREEEKIQFVGPAKKAHYCITKGVQFVQIDLENIAEFETPNLEEDMRKIREKLGVRFAFHSETKAFGIEVAEPDSAIEMNYKFGHKRLYQILENAGKLGSEYLLIHASESVPFLYLERHLQPAILVDFWGRPLTKFLEENKELLNWLLGGRKEEVILALKDAYDNTEKKEDAIALEKLISENFKKRNIKPPDYIWRELFGGRNFSRILADIIREEVRGWVMRFSEPTERPSYERLEENRKIAVDTRVKVEIERTIEDLLKRFLDFIQSRHLHYGPERFAYWIIAKWMELNEDPLWKPIIDITVKYFAYVEGKSPEEWLKEKGIERFSIDDDNFRELHYLWVPCVAAKYIYGHLMQDKNPERKKYKDIYPDWKEPIKKYNMPLLLESPMAHPGIEEWLRFPNPLQFCVLAKVVNEEVGFECLAVAMDFEHMLSLRLDPEKVIECLPEGWGKYVRCIHIGYPSPLVPAHIPIPLGSEQQKWLYQILFKLRQKGFGKDEKDYYIIFERGGGVDPIKQSIIALRKIVEYLEKDVPPDKLPLDFYGISLDEIASPERQWEIIFQHAFDPLKGLLMFPEEEHGVFGKAAVEKGKAEVWKKEELK